MARFKRGDMLHGDVWNRATLNLIPTNSTINSDGRLIMGRGIARQVSIRYRGIDKILGTIIGAWSRNNFTMKVYKQRPYIVYNTPYQVITAGFNKATNGGIGIFQIKEFFAEPASLEIINFSTQKLNILARENPDISINLYYPGIGYGRLKKTDVQPILSILPDNVTVWEYVP